MSLNIQTIQQENKKTDIPELRAGDTITVNVKVIEGTKERIQPFKGVIIQQKNTGERSQPLGAEHPGKK